MGLYKIDTFKLRWVKKSESYNTSVCLPLKETYVECSYEVKSKGRQFFEADLYYYYSSFKIHKEEKSKYIYNHLNLPQQTIKSVLIEDK